MAYILKVNGDIEQLPDTKLETLQKAVGGYIEIIGIAFTKKVMVVDEEGKLKDYPPNPLATFINRGGGGDDVIVGDVVIADRKEIE